MKIGALCAALVAALYLADPSLLGAEWWLFDIYSRQLAKSRPADPRIVLVPVDDASITNLDELYGRPPYPREVWALVVDELERASAKVIAFDVLFTEENPASPEGDRAFAASLEGAPVILAGKPHPMFRPAGTGSIHLARDLATVHTYPLKDSLALVTARHFDPSIAAGGELLVRWNGAKRKPQDLSYANVRLDKVILAALQREEGSLDPATADAFAKQFRGRSS